MNIGTASRTFGIYLLCTIFLHAGASAQNTGVTLDAQLTRLSSKGVSTPVFACLGSGQDARSATDIAGLTDEQALVKVAKSHYLDVFDIGGVKVLGPRSRFAPNAQSPTLDEIDWATPPVLVNMLLSSLTPAQVAAIIGDFGLQAMSLSREQADILARLLTLPVTVQSRKMKEIDTPMGTRGKVPEYKTLDAIPTDRLVLKARLDTGTIDLRSDTRGIDLSPLDPESGWLMVFSDRLSGAYGKPTGCEYHGKIIPNAPSAGDLDLGASVFSNTVTPAKRCTVAQLVSLLAKTTGLELHPDVGFGRLTLATPGHEMTARQVAEALSIAIPCTWRKVGPAYVLGYSQVGVAALVTSANRTDDLYKSANKWYERAASDIFTRPDVLAGMKFKPDDQMALSSAQIDRWYKAMVAKGGIDRGGSDKDLTMDFFTPEQMTELERRLEEFRKLPSADANPIEIPDLSTYTRAGLVLSVDLIIDIPGLGETYLTTPDVASDSAKSCPITPGGHPSARTVTEEMDQMPDPPPGARITLPAPVRGLLYCPSKGDKASEIVADLKAAGMNTLYLRVFHNGCTLFPSRQFPTAAGFEDGGFLKAVTEAARANGIKVIGVVDVLRWADGKTSKHWIYDHADLLDLDASGQNMQQSSRNAPPYGVQERMEAEASWYGQGFNGEFVSPFHPNVPTRLKSLLGELSTCGLGGLALDYTAIPGTQEPLHPEHPSIDAHRTLGYNESARLAFLRKYGADPVDLPPPGDTIRFPDPDEETLYLPAHEVLSCIDRRLDREAADELWRKWILFRREKADELLAVLARHWRTTSPGTPLQLIDTYSSHEDVHNMSKLAGLLDVRVLFWGRAMEMPESTMLIRLTREKPDKFLYVGMQMLGPEIRSDCRGIILELPEGLIRSSVLHILKGE